MFDSQHQLKQIEDNSKEWDRAVLDGDYKDKYFKAFTSALKVNTVVKVAGFTNMTLSTVESLIIFDLCDMIRNNTSINYLQISSCDLDDAHFQIILNQFSSLGNQTIKELCFSCNNITDNSAAVLANFIRYTDVITEIDLSYNNITDAGLLLISEAFAENKTIKRVSLSNNPCGFILEK